LRSRNFEFQPAFPYSSLGERGRDVLSYEDGVVDYIADFAIANLDENCIAEERASMLPIPEPIQAVYPVIADVAITNLDENCTAEERASMLLTPEPIPAVYPATPDSYNEAALSANVPDIMSIKDAEKRLRSEQRRHWAHLEKRPKIGQGLSQRQGQNRINKYISRWKNEFYLDTAEDYYILVDAVRDKREGKKPQRVGRQRLRGQPSA
jgi:hypothetical protein